VELAKKIVRSRTCEIAMSLVSVIIPSYNHSPYIRQAVESVLCQSYANLELIVIDDGSTDASLDFLRSVNDSRYKLIEQANAGAHNAINKGLLVAKGKYLAVLNSDDVFHQVRLAACIERLRGGVELVATWIEIINHEGDALGIKEGWRNMLPWPVQQPEHNIASTDAFTFNLLMTNFVSTTSNIVFTRALYEKIGGMKNLRFVHDWDFLLRAARCVKCELIERPLLQYRTHQTNTISSNRAWMLFEICWIFAVHLKHFKLENFLELVDEGGIADKLNFLAHFVNLQGNDKVMWMLLKHFDECERLGELNPEDRLLDDERLRSAFVNHITV
jgi:glycosyltransferase involved in cell wall biosynthesis